MIPRTRDLNQSGSINEQKFLSCSQYKMYPALIKFDLSLNVIIFSLNIINGYPLLHCYFTQRRPPRSLAAYKEAGSGARRPRTHDLDVTPLRAGHTLCKAAVVSAGSCNQGRNKIRSMGMIELHRNLAVHFARLRTR